MDLKLSIIMPVYNAESYLNQSIESILNQTFTEFELILVNDGSTDKSNLICDNYAKLDKRVKVIHQKNKGVSAARNEGIKAATGKYIGFIDSDDTMENNMYEYMLKYGMKYNVDIVVCKINIINQIDNSINSCKVWEKTNVKINKCDIQNTLIPSILTEDSYGIIPCYNKIYKRTLFDKFNIIFDINRSHGEDARLNLNLISKIDSIFFIDKALYNYYIRDTESLTSIFREDKYNYILDSKNFGISLCKEYNLYEQVNKLIYDYVILTIGYMNEIVCSNNTKQKKYKLLMAIMNDKEFIDSIKKIKMPSLNYKILKIVCILRSEKIFYILGSIKNKLKTIPVIR